MGKIWENINELAKFIEKMKGHGTKIVMTSGGFDPLHVGHLRCLQASTFFGTFLVVVVNGDEFLMNKKGYVFMPEKERLEIVASMYSVDHVVRWYDGTQFVAGAIDILKPHTFTKGGDRSTPDAIAQAEHEACARVGCKIEYGVGGTDKAQSSSILAKKAKDADSKKRRT